MKRTPPAPYNKKNIASSAERIDARVRAVRRKRARRNLPRLLWIFPFSLVFLTLCAMLTANFSQFRRYQKQADFKSSQLAALQETQNSLEHRLAFLRLPQGRQQILREHGFIKAGERYLQFPEAKNAAKTAAGATSSTGNDDAPVFDDKDADGSAWQRAARTFSGWINGLRGHKNPQS